MLCEGYVGWTCSWNGDDGELYMQCVWYGMCCKTVTRKTKKEVGG